MKDKRISTKSAELRCKAEERLKAMEAESQMPLSEPDTMNLIHELQIRKIELELQNEELIQAQNQNEAKLELLSTLYDFAPVGYFTVDQQSIIKKVNLTGAKLLGIERTQLINMRMELFVSEDTRSIFNTFLNSIFINHSTHSCEVTLQIETGTLIYVRLEAADCKDIDECYIAMIDISDRKHAENAYRLSEEKYSKTFLLSPDSVAINRLSDGSYIEVNEGFTNITGYTMKDFVTVSGPNKLSLWVNIEDRIRLLQILKKTGEVYNFQFPFRRKDGIICIGSMYAKIIEVAGEPCILSTTRDITEEKQINSVLQTRLKLIDFAPTHSMNELMQLLLDEAERLTGSSIGFLHFIDEDQNEISLQMWSTNTTEKHCNAQVKGWHYNVDKAGVWVDCLHQRKPIIHNDYEILPHRKGLPLGHAPLKRELVVPIFRNDLVVAIIGVGNKQYNYVENDIEILQSLADLTWDIIQHKKTEEALITNQALLDDFTDNSESLIYAVDTEGKYLLLNRAFEKLFNIKREDVIGKARESMMPSEFAAEHYANDLQVIENRMPTTFEEMNDEPDGKHVYFSVKFPLINAQGNLYGIGGISTDITKRKSAEESLRASEEIFKNIFESANVGKSITLPNGIIRVNKAFTDLLGYSQEEMQNKAWQDFTLAEDIEYTQKHIDMLLSGEKDSVRFCKRFVHKNGSIVWTDLSSVIYRTADEIPIHLITTIIDITDRKQVEDALRISEEKWHSLFTILPVGVSILDMNQSIISVNTALEKILDIPADRLLNGDYKLRQYIKSDNTSMTSDELPSTLALKKHQTTKCVEIGVVKEDNSVIWTEVSAAPLPFSDAACVVVTSDITERKQNEYRQQLTTKILSIVNENTTMSDAISRILTAIKHETGFDAVGLRLQKGEDFPYYNQYGFTEDFLLTENTLTVSDSNAMLCRDENGNISLECTCGLVISGQADLTSPPFTPGGSFWTNDSSPFLDTPPDQEQRFNPRNRCIHEGFLSVALIPIRINQRIVGLLQMNDRRKDRFTLDLINYFEDICGRIGLALMQMQIEKDLRESKEHLTRAELLGEFGSWEFDLNTKIVTTSEGAKHIYCLPDDKITLDIIQKAPLPEYRSMLDDALNKLVTENKPYDVEFKIKRGTEGAIVDIHSIASYNKERNTIFGIIHNVTERKQMEVALRDSEERHLSMISNISDVIAIMDTNGIITYTSPNIQKLFGWKPEELVRTSGWDTIHPDDLQRIKNGYPALFGTNNTPRTMEYRYKCKDGSYKWIELTAVDMTDNPSINGVLMNYHDITERKQVEEEKLRLEQQLQQTAKLESLGVLAGGIAHDFNNLLMGMLGYAELSLTELTPYSPARGSIKEIITGAHRAAELCRQMLAYSGKASFASEQLNLGTVIHEMIHLLKTSISKKVHLNLQVEHDLSPITADPSQIRQIVMNLIINASEAIGEENGVISIWIGTIYCDDEYLRTTELLNELKPGKYVQMEISDTGCGMDAATLERMFEPFFTTKFTGRGLGLAAVLGIVRAQNGALKVTSQPGKGTTFIILFPAVNIKESKPQLITDKTEDNWQGSGTILLADDEEIIRSIGTRLLKRLGFNVLTASDGYEAVAAYRDHGTEIDLVMLDMTMPNMDGTETFKELRNLNPNVRVLMSSGYSKEDIGTRFVGNGLVGFLQKPFTLASLRETIMGIMLKNDS